jgi:hypothetical protein
LEKKTGLGAMAKLHNLQKSFTYLFLHRGMYDLTEFGTDDKLWQLIALCAGTGGSILVIGSASGVALMGLEKVDFVWYAKKVSIGATIGYFAGIATYLAQYALVHGGGIGGLLPQAAVAADMLQQNAAAIM